MKHAHPVLPLPHFQRISNAAAGLILAESGRLIGKCVLFGLMGEQLLRRRYNFKDARVVVGAFAVCIAPKHVLAFSGHEGPTNNIQGFHCWIEAGGFVFDFSSFLYPSLASEKSGIVCPALMFQKPIGKKAQSLEELRLPGDFYLQEDESLREKTIEPTLEVIAVQDDLEILASWYRPPPKSMPVIGLAKGNSHPEPVSLHNAVFIGAW